MKGTLLKRTGYLYVHISGFLRGIFVKLHTSHFPRMRYIWCTLGCDRSMMKGLYFENKARFLLYLGFHKLFSLNSIHYTSHACVTSDASLVAIMNGNLLAGEGNFSASVMATVREIPLKLHPSHFPPMRYRVCKFSSYMTIIQGTLLGEQSVFSAVSRLSEEASYRTYTPQILQQYATKGVCLLTKVQRRCTICQKTLVLF